MRTLPTLLPDRSSLLDTLLLAAALCAVTPAWAQGFAPAAGDPGWQSCKSISDAAGRLACFDAWAQGQAAPRAAPAPASASASASAAEAARTSPPATGVPLRATALTQGCHDRGYSELSRFWELEQATDCGSFDIRGYRPISLSVVAANNINNEPTSGNPANSALTAQTYRSTETRLQLSVRTKLAKNLLTRADQAASDSLWFGYTQQSYWQLFNRGISRPFRSTDHEPEMVYVYPTDAGLPGGWRLRYSGVGLVHQSNGQALPLSRSWNRAYLMAGMEHGNDFRLQARLWKRVDGGSDDNPGISDYIGRGELVASWSPSRQSVLSATVRHPLTSSGRGSLRLEWLRAIGTDAQGAPAGLRLHTQLFTGYGDSLLDYNYRRTVLSVGLSLVEW
ncbi:MAG: Phospholipase [Ramlibacter sp.]|nr:Phospholipase [Ramlibacter sp.]